ncbi:hypothetical protein E6C50_07375 [Flavobacterium supellecticarium]|uniref:Lipoprotein n=1 Tax=Flavobacterium supellecticarium TaxID=2565924 RepID=A0A4S3ZZW7_9FLAO|nr:DUF6624 domain-containing protein [Flavobacterium supellecticarium]THF51576.1 hypothetical protein E6C50_07375 [Flavobacterium supellecticarium]
MGRILKKISFYGIICFGFIMILFTSCSCSKPYSEEMKTELARMFKKDQELQDWDVKRLEDRKYTDSMQTEMSKTVRANCETIKKYYKECGYPGLKENGRDACVRFWLVVQHSDHDVIFQEKMLKALKRQLKKKNALVRNYAYLYDRVMKNKGKKQKYGTQLGRRTGGEKMHPIPELEFPDKVDELRKEMGLGTLKEYVDSFEN